MAISTWKCAMLTSAQLRELDDLGYLAVPDVVPQAVIDEALADCEEIAAGLVDEAVARGEAAGDLVGEPMARQVIELTRRTGRSYGQYFDISFPVRGELSASTPINLRPGFFQFLTCQRLLDVVEDVVGPEVFCNPVQHLRLKLPRQIRPEGAGFLTATVPLHQDIGVVAAEADGSHILTVWAPLNAATKDNGCLEVIPGSHRNLLLSHCMQTATSQYGVPEEITRKLGERVPLEMRPGSVLLLHQRTVHGSLDNRTGTELRISLDLRYQPVGEPSGRPLFRGFVARSRRDPASALTSAAAWQELWESTRRRLPPVLDPAEFFRWGPGDVCA
jgi:phytanoyl-CoA hydroxylase